MKLRFSVAVAVAIATALSLGVSPATARRVSAGERAVAASRYIIINQNEDGTWPQSLSPLGTTADGVVALVATRRGPEEIRRSLDYLESHVAEATTVGLKAKLIMAAVAGGRDPKNFGGVDLVQQIKESRQPNGQYGAHTAAGNDSEVYDHALAIIGLTAGGVELVPSSVFNWLLNAQCDDGGWQSNDPAADADDEHCFNSDAKPEDFYLSDTNTTSIVVQALNLASDTRNPRVNPFEFFNLMRDEEKGGWGFDPNFRSTSTDSTALVIQAYAAAKRPLPDGAMRALKRLQHPLCGPTSGAFAFSWERDAATGKVRRGEPNVASTIAAVLGLFKQPLPLPFVEVTKGAPRTRPC